MMNKVTITLYLGILLVFPFGAYAAQISSASYNQNIVISGGGQNQTSGSYGLINLVGIISGVLNSASYINNIGFLHLLLLANGQPCNLDNQCEGHFCCSNLCSSSSCPTVGGGSPSASSGGSGSSGGAGGGAGTIVPSTPKEETTKAFDYSVSPSSIQEQISLGSKITKSFTIKNAASSDMIFTLSGDDSIKQFISLQETSFSIEAGKEKSVQFGIFGARLGSYFGDIKISAGGIEKAVTVVLDIESTLVLFDVKVDIPSAYKEIAAGDDLKEQITLFNVGAEPSVDVTPTYIIRDQQGKAIYESSETFAVQKQKSYVKTIKMPKDMAKGDYLSIVEVRYGNSFAVSSELFRIGNRKSYGPKVNPSTLVFVLFVFMAMTFLFAYFLVPKIGFGNKLKKCYRTIEKMERSIQNEDIALAKRLHAQVKKIYLGLGTNEKQAIRAKLKNIYKRLK